MITNFEEETKPLTDEELKYTELLVKGFSGRTKENPIKAPEIIEKVNSYLHAHHILMRTKLSEPRLRKLCNHIRTQGIIPLIATSHGYYVSYDKKDIMQQITSLRERADAILNSTKGLEKFLIA